MRIMVGFDGSRVAGDALLLARKHAKAFDGKIEVVTTVLRGAVNNLQKSKEADNDLVYVQTLFGKSLVPIETHLLTRDLPPGRALVEFAEENNIDEIIVGVRRRSKVGKLVFGSTAQYVTLHAPCPVVIVK